MYRVISKFLFSTLDKLYVPSAVSCNFNDQSGLGKFGMKTFERTQLIFSFLFYDNKHYLTVVRFWRQINYSSVLLFKKMYVHI